MPTQKPSKSTGAKTPQKNATQAAAQKKLPIKAVVNWLNLDENSNVRASASLTIGDAFAVHGIKVINGQKGEFVSMPTYKARDGYKDIFHAVTADARQQMNEAVMDAYEQKLAEQENSPQQMDDEPGAEPEPEPEPQKGQDMKM